jgi:hypothetical protein
MQYKESEEIWILEGQLEFNRYENYTNSVIYSDLHDDTENNDR